MCECVFVKNSTCASLARRYSARVRRLLGPSNANMDKPATEPATILHYSPLIYIINTIYIWYFEQIMLV